MTRVPWLTPLSLIIALPISIHAQTPRYNDADAPIPARVADLISRMTLEEKISQLTDSAASIERLGVPEYGWWNEALHGVARTGLATVFPQAIGLAATWDDSLMLRIATVISDEARAKHHDYARQGRRMRYQGLTIFSPNINLFRDPRWGRGHETYGEDPFLTSRMAVQFIRGLQGDDPQYLKTVATVKHYAVHSGPEPERHHFDAVVNERDLRESYLPHFEAGIREAGAFSLMCAYNRVFGKAACASDTLLQNILRDEWGFAGYVVSDCGAINDIYERHKLVATAAEAGALGVRAGTDLECGRVYRGLKDAVAKGLIRESEIDTAVARLFTARFRLGMFDPPSRVKYANIPLSIVDQPAHRELALQAARESIVLLENRDNTLPLRKDMRSIAVIGPNADDAQMMFGNYNGMPSDPVTPLRGIREAVGPNTKVLYARGAEIAPGFGAFVPVPPMKWRAEYFANRDLAGTPVFTTADSAIDENWWEGAPRAGMNADSFSVRWTGELKPDVTGTYQLGLFGTMKFELFVNDSLMVRSTYSYRDEFPDPRLRTTAPLTLEKGKAYRLRIEAHETYGDAHLQLLWVNPRPNLMRDAVAAARAADAVVLFLGLTPRLEGEEMDVAIEGFRGGDRTSIDLPLSQQQLLGQISVLRKPTVVVLLNGSAIAVNRAQQQAGAIIEAWYPGQAGGKAIAEVLFGDYNPGGRLPVTFYQSTNDLPAFDNYAMQGRTYRFFGGKALYPFGHGLSYTTFKYDNLRVSNHAVSADRGIEISADVTNRGSREGDEVVQLYVQHLDSRVPRAIEELKGYTRISLRPGEKRTVTMPLRAQQLAYWDSTTHKWTLEADRVRIMIGSSSADIRLSDTIAVQTATLRLPRLFQDGMLLQRDTRIPVWGWAAAGAAVEAALGANTARATADARGEWQVQFPAQKAGGPFTLTIRAADDTIALRDVLVGDVWVASGQSNMEWPLSRASNASAAIAAARDPMLRQFQVPHGYAEAPQSDLGGGSWTQADAQHAGDFSAIAYFFARGLRKATGIPIGIIHTSWGGSNIETWMSRAALGIGDAEWGRLLQSEREYHVKLRETLLARLGDLPEVDAGLAGGKAVWADPQLDDSRWNTIRVPSLWEEQGYEGMDGVAWYRTRFDLTAEEAAAGVTLSLGMIDDEDITWVNGVEVGHVANYTQHRIYKVPASALRAGENVIAIRVTDGGGGGGIWGDPLLLFVETRSGRRPLPAEWRFKVGSVLVQPSGQRINKIPSLLYNQMLYPLQRFPIKGAIWYQGESNANNEQQAIAYRPLFAKMIQSWRQSWQGSDPEFPFLWVQLPNFGNPDSTPPRKSAWAYLRESQHAALALPKTAEVVAIDVGDPADIHPTNKEPVGQRMAQAARIIAYGETLLASGPVYRRHSVRDGTVVIEFDHVGKGLISRSGANVKGFAVAGADQQWVWADARIEGNRIIVSSAQVRDPVAVRYAWSNSPVAPALFNRDGWPATPFRTDSW